MLSLTFNFKPKFLYIYEEVANIGHGNEIQFCIPSFFANGFYLKDSPPSFDFDANKEATKCFFTFDHITNNYAYIDFGGVNLNNGQSGSTRYAFRNYNQGKIVGNTFYWYAKGERKASGLETPIEDIDDRNNSKYQFNYTEATYYWVAF